MRFSNRVTACTGLCLVVFMVAFPTCPAAASTFLRVVTEQGSQEALLSSAVSPSGVEDPATGDAHSQPQGQGVAAEDTPGQIALNFQIALVAQETREEKMDKTKEAEVLSAYRAGAGKEEFYLAIEAQAAVIMGEAASKGYLQLLLLLLTDGIPANELYREKFPITYIAEAGPDTTNSPYYAPVLVELIRAFSGALALLDAQGRTMVDVAITARNYKFLGAIYANEDAAKLISAKDDRGRTALHVAAALGQSKTFKSLCQFYCDMKVRDDGGNTPLEAAIVAGKLVMVKQLLDMDPSVAANGRWSTTVLHKLVLAVDSYPSNIDFEAIFKRLASGHESIAVNQEGETALMLAIRHVRHSQPQTMSNCEYLVKLAVVAQSLLVESKDTKRTAAMLAFQKMQKLSYVGSSAADIARRLSAMTTGFLVPDKPETVYKVNGADAEGRTLLHWAAQAAQVDRIVVERLVGGGWSVMAVDQNGDTPRVLAGEYRNSVATAVFAKPVPSVSRTAVD